VCCSGDKLLGGPQAGLIVGREDAIDAARKHPLARALRIDKLTLAALEATLRLYRDPARARQEIPVLAMLEAEEGVLLARSEQIVREVGSSHARVIRAVSRVGGGALPLLELEGPVVALTSDRRPVEVLRALREGDPPVVGRIQEDRVLLDPRTMIDEEVEPVIAAAVDAVAG
jgi:L-seryl-tRNA(Ser) seleniumtransferase